MNGSPAKTVPLNMKLAELALLGLAAAAPLIAYAQSTLPDAALLEFLADWNAADSEWLDAELTTEAPADEPSIELSDDALNGSTPSTRAEKGHE